MNLMKEILKKAQTAKIITEEKNKMRKEIEQDITKIRDYIETIIRTSNEEGLTKAIKHFKKIYKIEFEKELKIENLKKEEKEELIREIGEEIIKESTKWN